MSGMRMFHMTTLFLPKCLCHYNYRKHSYPTFCPVHTEHLVLVGRQVIQRSLAAVTHKKESQVFNHTKSETQKKDEMSTTTWQKVEVQ